jgi:UDP-N-acetylmuramoylalanine--D-glutamate ligase
VITSRLWRGKRYAVLGLARSGVATVRALLASGAEVLAWDADEGMRSALIPPPRGEVARSAGGGTQEKAESGTLAPSDGFAATSPQGGGMEFADPLTLDLTGFTAVIVSPGVPLNRHPIAARAAKFGVPIIGDIELFAQARAELPPHKVVGITGTNGKSTTTALVHHVLKTAGVPTTMGGNIGLPILGQEPLAPNDKGVGVYVLELSSYQIDLTFTLDCDVAVLLNITPDHLDRYDGFEAYAASKARLFAMQATGHRALIGDASLIAMPALAGLDPVQLVNPATAPLRQSEWPSLQGPHNAQNAKMATMACAHLGLKWAEIARSLKTYPGLPHRMERIRDRDGVLFVNDSKATNPTSAAPALAAYPAVHWILGGQAKTDELDACAPHFGHVKAAYTIGRDGPMLAKLLRPHMIVSECTELREAVRRTSYAAKPGETVLLSPACASFDQFANFEARGDAFRQLVEAL